ncbi:hypothetical protein HAX54_007287 [Datura stramonium]|uniref:Uncharacterized protein n=1 Tax=Datura stramonium TaxID=4076 RepID=A0ABS8TD16_DATST|nr:hypothetical protein [Datura stramonium]
MAVIMERLKMLTSQVMETKVWSVNAIGPIERMEQIDDEVYFLNNEKECVVVNHRIGMDVKGPLVGKATMNPEFIGCYGKNIMRNVQTPHNRVDDVDEESAKFRDLNKINEFRMQAYESASLYKSRMKHFHD